MPILPITNTSVELKPYMPHGVYAKVQEIALRGIKIDTRSAQATKEELLHEFGKEEMERVDALPQKEHDARLSEMRQEYLRRRIHLDSSAIAAAEDANIARIEGMVETVDGNKIANIREWADTLPEPDFQALLREIENIEANPEWKKNLSRSEGDHPRS